VLSINDVALDTASVSEAMRQLQCDAGDQLVLEILSSNSSITCQFLTSRYTMEQTLFHSNTGHVKDQC